MIIGKNELIVKSLVEINLNISRTLNSSSANDKKILIEKDLKKIVLTKLSEAKNIHIWNKP